nr:MAG TPA: hypothetical protein [Bacteriophage sp.]
MYQCHIAGLYRTLFRSGPLLFWSKNTKNRIFLSSPKHCGLVENSSNR